MMERCLHGDAVTSEYVNVRKGMAAAFRYMAAKRYQFVNVPF